MLAGWRLCAMNDRAERLFLAEQREASHEIYESAPDGDSYGGPEQEVPDRRKPGPRE